MRRTLLERDPPFHSSSSVRLPDVDVQTFIVLHLRVLDFSGFHCDRGQCLAVWLLADTLVISTKVEIIRRRIALQIEDFIRGIIMIWYPRPYRSATP